ncbi:hypothetical protein PISL3812_09791 [Talaromyces islandicus]|uniref:F-box domain-containing protein n=1 Tax=Talaromyces islandicus TaxID=28573 RepID=A0A0U1MAZ2_TALIS|nr:hypothetical protein PISL3812_09791 [Talaromyces islandicus]
MAIPKSLDSLIYDIFCLLIPYHDIEVALSLTQVNQWLRGLLWNEKYARQVMKIHATYSEEYAMACQQKQSFKKALLVFVGVTERIRNTHPSSIAQIESLGLDILHYKHGHNTFCYAAQEKQPVEDNRPPITGKTTLYHINIAQLTAITKDMSDETDTPQRYTIRKILFCSSAFIVLYSEGLTKKKIRLLDIKNGQLRRSGNFQLLPEEQSPMALLEGKTLLLCTFIHAKGWKITVINMQTKKRIAMKNIGLSTCLPHNIDRYFCFGAFRGTFYVTYTTQPFEPTFSGEDPQNRDAENRDPENSDSLNRHDTVLDYAREFPHDQEDPPFIEEDFYTIGYMPLACDMNIEWKVMQRWRKGDYKNGTVTFSEFTELWLECHPADGDVLIMESRLEVGGSGKKRVLFQQAIGSEDILVEEGFLCQRRASYAYMSRAATYLEVLNGKKSLILRSSISTVAFSQDHIQSEYTTIASDFHSLALKGNDSSFILIYFDPSMKSNLAVRSTQTSAPKLEDTEARLPPVIHRTSFTHMTTETNRLNVCNSLLHITLSADQEMINGSLSIPKLGCHRELSAKEGPAAKRKKLISDARSCPKRGQQTSHIR